jgi:hypothetical protein
VVALGIDRHVEDDTRPRAADCLGSAPPDLPDIPSEAARLADADQRVGNQTPAERSAEYKATVEAEYRQEAVDRGCDRVREIERTVVTPAMLGIEAEDPGRRLAGLENCLKGRERLAEKVIKQLAAQPDLTPNEAFLGVKDAIRYTFQYDEDKYAVGATADCERLKAKGFELVNLRNTWSREEYKGVNSWWREPVSGLLLEVQFHTQASYEAKQLTHAAYERIRDPGTPDVEVDRLRAFQREVFDNVPIPPNAADISRLSEGGSHAHEDHVLRHG